MGILLFYQLLWIQVFLEEVLIFNYKIFNKLKKKVKFSLLNFYKNQKTKNTPLPKLITENFQIFFMNIKNKFTYKIL